MSDYLKDVAGWKAPAPNITPRYNISNYGSLAGSAGGMGGSVMGAAQANYLEGLSLGTREGMAQAQIGNLNAQTELMGKQAANTGFGFNLGTMNTVLGGLGAISNMYYARKNYKLAKDQWATQKSVMNTNMMNQIQSYNTALRDKAEMTERMSSNVTKEDTEKYVEENKMRKH